MTWRTRPRSEASGALAWWCEGTGDPVVLVHGVGLRAEAWAAQVEGLAGAYSLYALDLPGHGDSPAPAQAPALGDITDRVAAAVAGIGSAVCMAGHSLGALVSLDLAVRYPALCRGVAALSPVFRRSPEAAEAVRWRAASMREDRPADPEPTLRRWYGDSRHCAEAEACRQWLVDTDPAAYQAAYAVFARADGPASADLAGIRCPCLFMTGAADPNSTSRMSREMAGITPNGRVQIVEGAAHMLPMTHAAQVNAELSAFFARCFGADQ